MPTPEGMLFHVQDFAKDYLGSHVRPYASDVNTIIRHFRKIQLRLEGIYLRSRRLQNIHVTFNFTSYRQHISRVYLFHKIPTEMKPMRDKT